MAFVAFEPGNEISALPRGGLRGLALRSGVITFSAQFAKFLLNLVSTIVLARLLTPADYGLIGMVTALTGFATLFTDLGLSAATVQRAQITHAQVSNLFWVNVALSTATALLLVGAAPLISAFYGNSQLTWIVIVLSSNFLFAGLTVQHQALMLRHMQFGAVAAVEVAAHVISIAVAVFLATQKAGVWSLVAMHLTYAAGRCVGVWGSTHWIPSGPTRNVDTRSLLRFGSDLTGFNLVNYWARNVDNVLIARFWGAAELGLYSRAYGLLLLPIQQINAPITRVAVPLLSRLVAQPDQYRRAYLGIVEKLVIITMPLAVLLIVTSDWIISTVLGPQWLEAAGIFSLLGIAAFTQPLSNTTGWLFTTQGRSREFFRWGLIGSTLAIASIIAGLPWGAVGVAASYSISGLFVRTPLLYWMVGRRGHVTTRDLYSVFPPAIVASAALLVVLMQFRTMWDSGSPVLGLSIALMLTGVVVPLGTAVLPSGRHVLRDFWRTARLMWA